MREIGSDGEITFVSSSQQQTSIVVRTYWNFIRIHPIVFTITEIQTIYVSLLLFMYLYCYVYVFLLLCMCCILFHRVLLCIVCV